MISERWLWGLMWDGGRWAFDDVSGGVYKLVEWCLCVGEGKASERHNQGGDKVRSRVRWRTLIEVSLLKCDWLWML